MTLAQSPEVFFNFSHFQIYSPPNFFCPQISCVPNFLYRSYVQTSLWLPCARTVPGSFYCLSRCPIPPSIICICYLTILSYHFPPTNPFLLFSCCREISSFGPTAHLPLRARAFLTQPTQDTPSQQTLHEEVCCLQKYFRLFYLFIYGGDTLEILEILEILENLEKSA